MQQELVERAIRGDQAAFSVLAHTSVDRLYAIANLILRDADRAEDAVQEALIAAWRDVRGLRDPAAWDSWTNRLTVWACYRLARKERRRSVVELRVAPDPEPMPGPDAAAVFADHEMVMRWLDGLTIDHRAVIVLRFYRDLSVEEVAKVLDIPAGTVKSRIHRALGVLRLSAAGQPGSSAALFREETA